MTGKPAVKHHYVPQSFIKEWSFDKKKSKVYILRKTTGEITESSISKIFFEKNLHTIVGVDEGGVTNKEQTLRYEDDITSLEFKINKQIKIFLSQDRGGREYILGNEKRRMDLIMAAFHFKVRHPKMLNLVAEDLEKDLSRDGFFKKASRFFRDEKKTGKHLSLMHLVNHLNEDSPIYIAQMNVLRSTLVNVRVIRSDNLICGDYPSGGLYIGNRFHKSSSTFPISPNKALVFSRDTYSIDEVMNMNESEFIDFSNKRQFEQSDSVIAKNKEPLMSFLV